MCVCVCVADYVVYLCLCDVSWIFFGFSQEVSPYIKRSKVFLWVFPLEVVGLCLLNTFCMAPSSCVIVVSLGSFIGSIVDFIM